MATNVASTLVLPEDATLEDLPLSVLFQVTYVPAAVLLVPALAVRGLPNANLELLFTSPAELTRNAARKCKATHSFWIHRSHPAGQG